MAEPSSTATALAVASGAGMAGAMAGINGDAAVGSLCGALIYFIVANELPLPTRLLFFLISFVMGYLFFPVMSRASIDLPFIGSIGPIELPGPAAFIAAAFVVSATMALLRSRGQAAPREG